MPRGAAPRGTAPREPGRTRWQMPGPDELADADDLVAVGADLAPATLLAAYRHGLFPMPLDGPDVRDGDGRRAARGALGWWSPDPRGVLPLDGLRCSRSLRRSTRRYEVTVDRCFAEVVDACGDPRRPHGWITREIRDAYVRLHELGWAHSVETWLDGELVGGLYGVAVDGLFAGESMFHRAPDASKVALVRLVELLRADGDPRRLLDVQWPTEHLVSLGVVAVPRRRYLELLAAARSAPPPPALTAAHHP